MKKLASILLAMLLVFLTVPHGKVFAETTSPLKSKLIVGEVNDACITLDTKEEYIIMGVDENGNYLSPSIVDYDEGTSFSYTTYNDSTYEYERNTIEGVNSLDSLKSYVKSNLDSIETSEVDEQTLLSELYVSSYVFFTSEGNYVDTVPVKTLASWLEDEDSVDFDGEVSVNVKPVGNTSANVSIKYDFSSCPHSLGGEELINFSIMSKDEVLAEGESSEGGSNATNYLNAVDSEDYIDEDNLVKGVTKDYTISKNGEYIVTLKTTQKEYERTFTISNIATKNNVTISKTSIGKAPKVTFSKLPKSIDTGRALKITMYTDKKSCMVFNGVSTKSGEYVNEKTFTVYRNGNYQYSAQTKDGAIKTGSLKVTCFKDTVGMKLDMNRYFGKGSGLSLLPQTGMNVNVWFLLFSVLSVIVGVLIVFRRKIAFKKAIRKLFTFLLVFAVTVTSVLAGYTTEIKAASPDGVGSTGVKGAYSGSGGKFETTKCQGFGIKFSLRNRSDLVNRHGFKKQSVVYDTLYQEGKTELYCTIAYNIKGKVKWSNGKLRMVFLDGNTVKWDTRFADMSEKQFENLFDFEASDFKKIMKNSGDEDPPVLDAKAISDKFDNKFSDRKKAGYKRLYTNKGRKDFYEQFVKILKNSMKDSYVTAWQKNVMSKEDFLKDGVLVAEPFAIFDEFKSKKEDAVVGITYPVGAMLNKKDNVSDIHRQWQAYIGEYGSMLTEKSGNAGILSCGAIYNGHGSKGCNFSPASGDYVSHKECSDCKKEGKGKKCEKCKKWEWEQAFFEDKRKSGNPQYGWGMYGMPEVDPESDKHSAINVSIKTTYTKDGKFTIDKQESMVSAKGFEDVSTDPSDMTAKVKIDGDEKKDFCGRQKLGDKGRKANVLNLPDSFPSKQDAYYGGYKMTSYGAFTVTDKNNTYKYPDLRDKLHGGTASIIPDTCQAKDTVVTGNDYNLGKYYELNYGIKKLDNDIYDRPKYTALLIMGKLGFDGNDTSFSKPVKDVSITDTAEQAMIAYNMVGTANNKSIVDKITRNTSGLMNSATTDIDNKVMGIAIQYLYKGKDIHSYISYAKLKYDEEMNATLTVGSNANIKYDITETGKFTPSSKRMYIVAVPNSNSSNVCLLKHDKSGSNIWGRVGAVAMSTKSILEQGTFSNIVSSNTGMTPVISITKQGATSIGVGSEKDDGYSIYVLEIETPTTISSEAALNVQDYQLNYVYPSCMLRENKVLGERINSDTLIYTLKAIGDAAEEGAEEPEGTEPAEEKNKDIILYHEKGTLGVTVKKANNGIHNILYNSSRGVYYPYSTIMAGNQREKCDNENLLLDYAFNLTRGVHGDRRTISSLSANKNGNQEFLKTNLDMDYGATPVTVNNGDAGLRYSWSKYYKGVADTICFSAKWDTSSATSSTAGGKEGSITANAGSTLFLTFAEGGGIPTNNVKHSILEKIFKYRTDLMSTGENKHDVILANGENLGGASIKEDAFIDSRIVPLSSVGATNPVSNMPEDERYRHAVVAKSDITLSYYPEVRMRAYETYGATISTGSIHPTTVLTMAEKIRKTKLSSMYLIRVTQPESGDQVKGTVYSDTMGTGTNADTLSQANGNNPVIYGGSDVTLKAEGKFKINLYGYALDLVNKNIDGSGLKYDLQDDGSYKTQPYADIVNDTSGAYGDPYSLWGNSGTNSKSKLFEQYKKFAESVKKNLYADVTLRVTGAGLSGGKRLYNDFNTSLGELQGGESSEKGVYNIYIRRGEIDTSDEHYVSLINQIAKDYNCSYEEAQKLFKESDIYQTIVRSIEDVNDDENESQVVSDTKNSVRSAESDKPWYDEEVKTFVIRRYVTTGLSTPNIILNDKIDYGLTPDSSTGTDSSYNAQQGNYKGYDAKWFLTLYFRDNKTTKDDTNMYLSEQSLYKPKNERVNTAKDYYKEGNVLINELYIAGADFTIPSATTSDMAQ